MSGQWAKDPYGRAELRYHDGSRWTEHIVNAGLQSVESSADSSAAAFPSHHLPQHTTMPYPSMQPAGYVQHAPRPTTATGGRLIAAGVMTIIEAVLALIFGLWMFSLTTSAVGGLADDLTGGALTFVALLVLVIGAALLTSGIGSCKGRNWARITVIVLHAIAAVIFVFAAIDSAKTTRTRTSSRTSSRPRRSRTPSAVCSRWPLDRDDHRPGGDRQAEAGSGRTDDLLAGALGVRSAGGPLISTSAPASRRRAGVASAIARSRPPAVGADVVGVLVEARAPASRARRGWRSGAPRGPASASRRRRRSRRVRRSADRR